MSEKGSDSTGVVGWTMLVLCGLALYSAFGDGHGVTAIVLLVLTAFGVALLSI